MKLNLLLLAVPLFLMVTSAQYLLSIKTDDERFKDMYLKPGKLEYEDPEGDKSTYLLASSEKASNFKVSDDNESNLQYTSEENAWSFAAQGDKTSFILFETGLFAGDSDFSCENGTLKFDDEEHWYVCTSDDGVVYEKPAIAFSDDKDDLPTDCFGIQISCEKP